MKLVCAAPGALLEEISKTIEDVGRHQQQHPAKVGKLPREEWATIAEALPGFLNAYLQQELARMLVHVEVAYKSPFGPPRQKCICHLACENRPATLTLEIATEHGEEHLPLVLHYHGEDHVWDKDESTPNNPVWVSVPVDRKVALFTDGLDSGDKTKQQWSRDEFLLSQGFHPIRFSPVEIQKDPFACAAKAVALITGKGFPTEQT